MNRHSLCLTLCALILSCSCLGAESAPPPLAYELPLSTAYIHDPELRQQYLKAHKAGWEFAVGSTSAKDLASSIAFEGISGRLVSSTCCEATQNVTLGWQKGVEDGNTFVASMIWQGKGDSSIVPRYKELLKQIEKEPVKDSYVFDGSNSKETVKEVKREGDITIETTYQDKTKSKLYEVQRYKNGTLHGFTELYDGNGRLQKKTPYKEGVIDGVQVRFSDTGAVIGKTPFRVGQEHGVERWYAEDGTLTAYREWEDGRQHGRDIEWHPDDYPSGVRLYRFQRWKNGKKHGLCVYYGYRGKKVSGQSGAYKDGTMISKLLFMKVSKHGMIC